MRFEKSPANNEGPGWCPECTWSAPLHHPCCPQHGNSTATLDQEVGDYSHLVGPPAMDQYKERNAVHFGGLLTDHDRVLLRFGMHIRW
jgi:hypothetical protein